jgi:hypothetical protein
MFVSALVLAQQPATVKPGPNGIYIFTGKEIPAGKSISRYKIERSVDKTNWKQVAEIATPSSFDAFKQAVERAKLIFPSQPLPQADMLNQLYKMAVATGNADSLKGMRLLFPIRVALGIMYYDTSASKHITYRYRLTAVKPSGESGQSYLTDTVSLPFQPKFDTITFSESSYNINSVFIKWKSAGSNPAPLFMVYKFRFGAPVVAHGNISQYVVNDTTYYVYHDTTVAKEAGKEMQFFISPYDQFGNSGPSSQVAVITQDNFNKAAFVKNHIAFMPQLSGVQVCWHFTDPFTVKTVEIYRSESARTGFGRLAEISSTDTSYLDQRIWPEKTYFYYVQVVAKAGKRTRQSDVMKVVVPGITAKEKLNAPILRQVAIVHNNIRLLIEVNDSTSNHIRVFRGLKGGLVSLPGLVKTNKAGFIEFTDSTLAPENRKDVFYAVRNEKVGKGISSLSDDLPVASIPDQDEVAYFYAFPSKGKTELYWDDVVNRKSNYVSYTIARKNGPANSRSPLMVLAEKLTKSSFSDDKAQAGNQYTYVLRLVDKAGNSSGESYNVTISSSK